MRLIDETAYQYKIAKIPMEERTFMRAWETAQNMPTIDAEPVVRGEWVTTRTIIHDGEPYCSLCGQEALAEYGRHTYIKSNYCPNCGAKMESEGKDE